MTDIGQLDSDAQIGGIPRRAFPALGAAVSQLGYGAWPLGGAFGSIDEEAGARSVRAYLEAGGNFIDTARLYGRAESVIGGVLKRWDGPTPLLATKILPTGSMRQWGAPIPVDVAFPPGQIAASFEQSLREMHLDAVDLIQLHIYWPGWGVEGYWLDELEALRERGLVRAIGVSIPDYRHDNALPLVLSGRIDSVQTIVNIFDPLALDNLAPIAAERGVAIIARGVLDEGGLIDTPQRERTYAADDLRRRFFGAAADGEYDRHTDELRTFLPRHAVSLPELALRAVLGHPAITTAILSMPTADLVALNVEAASQPPLPPDVLDRLWTRYRWVRNFFNADYWEDE